MLGKIEDRRMRESFPRQVDKKSRSPQGEEGSGILKEEERTNFFFPLHSLKVRKLSRSVVSDSLQPHGLCSLPGSSVHPWDFPGKSTGVGCHFVLQGDLPDPGIKP